MTRDLIPPIMQHKKTHHHDGQEPPLPGTRVAVVFDVQDALLRIFSSLGLATAIIFRTLYVLGLTGLPAVHNEELFLPSLSSGPALAFLVSPKGTPPRRFERPIPPAISGCWDNFRARQTNQGT